MLKILVVNDELPYVRNITSITFNNIAPILEQRLKIKICWFIFNEDIEKNEKKSLYEFFYILDFKNAREVIEKIKPSLIWVMPGNGLIDYSFLLTAKFLKIPTFGYGGSIPLFEPIKSKRKKIREMIRQFRENDAGKNIRGIKYIKKYLFLIRSLSVIEKSYTKIILELITMIKKHSGILFSPPLNEINKGFNCDLIFAGSNRDKEYLISTGLSKNNIVVTGNPTYDEPFTKRREDYFSESNKKLEILFLTVNLTSGQGESDWTVHNRNEMIRELILQYEKLKTEISLKIKIHPTSEKYSEYKERLEHYNNDIQLFQHEDLIQLIMKSDIILTTSASTAGVIALIMRKPVILWNYFNVHNDLFVKHNVVLECKSATELKNCFDKVKSFTSENQSKIDSFINDFFAMGNATENIVNEIEKLLMSNR